MCLVSCTQGQTSSEEAEDFVEKVLDEIKRNEDAKKVWAPLSRDQIMAIAWPNMNVAQRNEALNAPFFADKLYIAYLTDFEKRCADLPARLKRKI